MNGNSIGSSKGDDEANKNEDHDTQSLANKLEAMDLLKDLESSFEICDAEGELDEASASKSKSYYDRCLLS